MEVVQTSSLYGCNVLTRFKHQLWLAQITECTEDAKKSEAKEVEHPHDPPDTTSLTLSYANHCWKARKGKVYVTYFEKNKKTCSSISDFLPLDTPAGKNVLLQYLLNYFVVDKAAPEQANGEHLYLPECSTATEQPNRYYAFTAAVKDTWKDKKVPWEVWGHTLAALSLEDQQLFLDRAERAFLEGGEEENLFQQFFATISTYLRCNVVDKEWLPLLENRNVIKKKKSTAQATRNSSTDTSLPTLIVNRNARMKGAGEAEQEAVHVLNDCSVGIVGQCNVGKTYFLTTMLASTLLQNKTEFYPAISDSERDTRWEDLTSVLKSSQVEEQSITSLPVRVTWGNVIRVCFDVWDEKSSLQVHKLLVENNNVSATNFDYANAQQQLRSVLPDHIHKWLSSPGYSSSSMSSSACSSMTPSQRSPNKRSATEIEKPWKRRREKMEYTGEPMDIDEPMQQDFPIWPDDVSSKKKDVYSDLKKAREIIESIRSWYKHQSTQSLEDNLWIILLKCVRLELPAFLLHPTNFRGSIFDNAGLNDSNPLVRSNSRILGQQMDGFFLLHPSSDRAGLLQLDDGFKESFGALLQLLNWDRTDFRERIPVVCAVDTFEKGNRVEEWRKLHSRGPLSDLKEFTAFLPSSDTVKILFERLIIKLYSSSGNNDQLELKGDRRWLVFRTLSERALGFTFYNKRAADLAKSDKREKDRFANKVPDTLVCTDPNNAAIINSIRPTLKTWPYYEGPDDVIIILRTMQRRAALEKLRSIRHHLAPFAREMRLRVDSLLNPRAMPQDLRKFLQTLLFTKNSITRQDPKDFLRDVVAAGSFSLPDPVCYEVFKSFETIITQQHLEEYNRNKTKGSEAIIAQLARAMENKSMCNQALQRGARLTYQLLVFFLRWCTYLLSVKGNEGKFSGTTVDSSLPPTLKELYQVFKGKQSVLESLFKLYTTVVESTNEDDSEVLRSKGTYNEKEEDVSEDPSSLRSESTSESESENPRLFSWEEPLPLSRLIRLLHCHLIPGLNEDEKLLDGPEVQSFVLGACDLLKQTPELGSETITKEDGVDTLSSDSEDKLEMQTNINLVKKLKLNSKGRGVSLQKKLNELTITDLNDFRKKVFQHLFSSSGLLLSDHWVSLFRHARDNIINLFPQNTKVDGKKKSKNENLMRLKKLLETVTTNLGRQEGLIKEKVLKLQDQEPLLLNALQVKPWEFGNFTQQDGAMTGDRPQEKKPSLPEIPFRRSLMGQYLKTRKVQVIVDDTLQEGVNRIDFNIPVTEGPCSDWKPEGFIIRVSNAFLQAITTLLVKYARVKPKKTGEKQLELDYDYPSAVYPIAIPSKGRYNWLNDHESFANLGLRYNDQLELLEAHKEPKKNLLQYYKEATTGSASMLEDVTRLLIYFVEYQELDLYIEAFKELDENQPLVKDKNRSIVNPSDNETRFFVAIPGIPTDSRIPLEAGIANAPQSNAISSSSNFSSFSKVTRSGNVGKAEDRKGRGIRFARQMIKMFFDSLENYTPFLRILLQKAEKSHVPVFRLSNYWTLDDDPVSNRLYTKDLMRYIYTTMAPGLLYSERIHYEEHRKRLIEDVKESKGQEALEKLQKSLVTLAKSSSSSVSNAQPSFDKMFPYYLEACSWLLEHSLAGCLLIASKVIAALKDDDKIEVDSDIQLLTSCHNLVEKIRKTVSKDNWLLTTLKKQLEQMKKEGRIEAERDLKKSVKVYKKLSEKGLDKLRNLLSNHKELSWSKIYNHIENLLETVPDFLAAVRACTFFTLLQGTKEEYDVQTLVARQFIFHLYQGDAEPPGQFYQRVVLARDFREAFKGVLCLPWLSRARRVAILGIKETPHDLTIDGFGRFRPDPNAASFPRGGVPEMTYQKSAEAYCCVLFNQLNTSEFSYAPMEELLLPASSIIERDDVIHRSQNLGEDKALNEEVRASGKEVFSHYRQNINFAHKDNKGGLYRENHMRKRSKIKAKPSPPKNDKSERIQFALEHLLKALQTILEELKAHPNRQKNISEEAE